jgi:peptidoglycan/LPS O-acetylase OafA/YrhL
MKALKSPPSEATISTTRSLEYRKDIEGLRALSILAVIFYHFGFLPSGFLGVDLFFVISGYLITGIIATQVEQNRFSFYQFYLSRLRRLAPAYMATLLLTAIGAVILFIPAHLIGFANALSWTSVFMSNIFLGLSQITSSNTV